MTDHATRRRGRNARITAGETSDRSLSYRHLMHPFPPQCIFSEDRVEDIHLMAFRVLEELGIKMLLPEARRIYESAGGLVDEETEMVRIGREMVEASLTATPRSTRLRAINPSMEHLFEPGAMLFKSGAGCPNVTDMTRGRRPGSLADFEETLKLQQSFEVIHLLGLSAEPQDIPPHLRHFDMTGSQLKLSDKHQFVFSRGQGQVEDCFDIIRIGFDLSEEEFRAGAWATTVINTNSPRQIDRPMARGIIDFARHGQFLIVTPFCLAGAMAPITVEGALVLQHAEALAAITLSQLSAPGAPVAYGGFSSNVDMKSGAPAFGTPEHVKLTIGSGQLARHIGMPWRSAAGSASNTADMQGATENIMGLWGAMLANATLTMHSAGWLEGGLTFGYEKFINDVEALQSLAELCRPSEDGEDALGWSALAGVQPGGHFFDTDHTMRRYKNAFYQPLVADLSNFGTWTDAGSKSSAERATRIWQSTVANFKPPPGAGDVAERITPFVERRIKEGGAAPLA